MLNGTVGDWKNCGHNFFKTCEMIEGVHLLLSAPGRGRERGQLLFGNFNEILFLMIIIIIIIIIIIMMMMMMIMVMIMIMLN